MPASLWWLLLQSGCVPASLWWLLLQSGCVPASLWWLLLQSGCVSGFVVLAATSVWLCDWLCCGGCYFSLAVCPASLWWLLLQSGCVPASLWWLLLQSGCVSGFVVVAATSVWLCDWLRCCGCYFSLFMCHV